MSKQNDTNDKILIVNKDVRLFFDFDQGLVMERIEREAASYSNAKQYRVTQDTFKLLTDFSDGRKISSVLKNWSSDSNKDLEDALKNSILQLEELGILVSVDGEKPRLDSTHLPVDMEDEFKEMFDRCKEFSLTSSDKMYSLYQACKYVAHSQLQGPIVECGVWRGGSVMICALTLLSLGDTDREIHLYDTFSGMAPPTDKDVTYGSHQHQEGELAASLEDVKRNVFSTGYPKEKFVFVEGKVEDTLKSNVPGDISLLRLDTELLRINEV